MAKGAQSVVPFSKRYIYRVIAKGMRGRGIAIPSLDAPAVGTPMECIKVRKGYIVPRDAFIYMEVSDAISPKTKEG